MAFGLLLIRLAFGLALAAHGAQKLFGVLGGFGIAGTGGFFETLGFRPGKPFATLAGAGELGGGLALAFGFLTPFAASVLMASMLVAMFGVHVEKGFFAQHGGYEFPLLVAAAAAGLAFTGPGAISLDAAFGLDLSGGRWGGLAILLGMLGAIPPLALREGERTRVSAS
jgi:putative oxidoreductase